MLGNVPTSDDICDEVSDNFAFLQGALEPYFTDTRTGETETFYLTPLPAPEVGVWFPQLHLGIKFTVTHLFNPWEVFSPEWAVPTQATGEKLDGHFYWGDGHPDIQAALGAVLQVWFTNDELHQVLDTRCASGHRIDHLLEQGEE